MRGWGLGLWVNVLEAISLGTRGLVEVWARERLARHWLGNPKTLNALNSTPSSPSGPKYEFVLITLNAGCSVRLLDLGR